MAGAKRFSEKLSGMKFMQRGAEAKVRQRLEKEERQRLAEWQWVADERAHEAAADGGAGRAVLALDEEDEEGARAEAARTFRPGRRSFGNFNPKVERAVREQKEEAGGRAADDETLDERELAAHYAGAYERPAKRSKVPRKGGDEEGDEEERARKKKRKKEKRRDDFRKQERSSGKRSRR